MFFVRPTTWSCSPIIWDRTPRSAAPPRRPAAAAASAMIISTFPPRCSSTSVCARRFKSTVMKKLLYTVVVLLAVSCSKKLDDAYLNPNAPTVVPIESLLPGIIGSMVGASSPTGVSGGVAGDALVVGGYIQYLGDSNGQSNVTNLHEE